MVQLHPGFDHFAYFVLVLFAGVLTVEGIMMAVASIVPNFLMGIITGAGIQVRANEKRASFLSGCCYLFLGILVLTFPALLVSHVRSILLT
jgi:hypothetical protein